MASSAQRIEAIFSAKGVDQFEKAYDKAYRAAEKSASQMEQVNKKQSSGFLGSAKEMVKGLGVYKLIEKGISVVADSLDSAIDRFDALNQFPKMLNAWGYSAEDASKATDKLVKGIEGLPTRLDEITGNVQKLLASGLELDEATDVAIAFNNAMLSNGASSADARRGLTQYTQMLSTGKVDMQSWRSLVETMPKALDDVSKSLLGANANQNDLYEALKDGSITIDDFNDKMVELDTTTGGFADQALTATEGIKTSFTNLKTAVVNGIAGIITKTDEWLENNGLDSIAKNLNKLKPVISDVFGKFGDGLIKILDLGKQVKGVFTGDTSLSSILDSISASLDEGLNTITENLPKYLEKGKEILLNIGNGIIEAGPDFQLFLTDILISIGTFFLENAPTLAQTGADILLGLIDGIINSIPSMKETLGEIVQSIIDFFVNEGPTFVERGVEVVANLVNGLIQAIPDLIVGVIELIGVIAQTIWDNKEEIFMAGVEILIAIANGILSVLTTLDETIGEVMESIKTWISEKLSSIKQKGREILQNIADGISEKIQTAKNAITNVINGIINSISMKLNSIKNKGREIVVNIANGISEKINSVKNAINNVIQGVKNKIDEWKNNFFNAGKNIVNSIANGIRSSISTVTNAIGNVVQGIRNFLPFSPAKEGPLKDLDKLNFGGTIAYSIDKGTPEVEEALNEMLRFDGVETSINHELNNNPQSATINLRLGNRDYQVFVDDITNAQDKALQGRLAYQ